MRIGFPLRARVPGALLLAALLAGDLAAALPRFGDEVVAGGVTFLRDSDDAHVYHALPADPRLATDAGGKPRFSLMEFSFRGDAGEETAGALMNFMLTWGLDAAGEEKALEALRRVDPAARIAGALTVREGRYRVIVTNGDLRFVLAEGKASVLPGQPIAFSRRLEKDEADDLREALAADEGRVAAGFLLAVEALGPRVSARCTIDWDAALGSQAVGALGGDAPHTDATVRAAFDALRSAGAIAVEGAPDPAALGEIYRSFRTELFESVVAPAAGGDSVDVKYVRRESRRTGRITLSFDGSRSERRELFISGDLTEAIRGATADAAREVSTGR
jgi:hypothetical protein